MRFDANGGGAPNYERNILGGPAQDERYNEPSYGFELEGLAQRWNQRDGNDDYTQAGNLFRLMDDGARSRLIENVVGHMSPVRDDIKRRVLPHFYKADPRYGEEGIAAGLGIAADDVFGGLREPATV